MDPKQTRALNEALATLNHNINALHGRVAALMAYVAELPGAGDVDPAKVRETLATASLSPVDTSRSTFSKTPHSAAVVAADAIHRHARSRAARSRE